MRNLTEEDIKELTRLIDHTTEWLRKEGWCKKNEEGKNVFFNPETGKEVEFRDAEDGAVSKRIYQDGWFPVIVHTSFPDLKPTAPMNNKPDREKEFCYYSHKDHNRLFLFGDLMNCYIHGKPVEEMFSLVAKHWSRMPTLKDLHYVEDMWIHVHFTLSDENTDGERAHYELAEIGSWSERDKLRRASQ